MAGYRAKLCLAGSALALLGAANGAFAQTIATSDEVVVTGSRLVSGFTTPTPVSVMSSAQLEARAAVNVADVVQEIPSFRPSGPTQGVSGSFAVGQSLLDLRALGRTRTLVLVDGRRHAPNNTDGTWDTNMLPTSLVERVEVVTGGASAAYGSDAVAGVVNFILKEDLEGLSGNLQYGVSGHGGGQEISGGLGFGRSFAEGRGHFMAGFDLSDSDEAGTMYDRSWGQKEPGVVQLTAARPSGVPAFVMTERAQFVLAPGSLITSCVRGGVTLNGAACPVGNLTFTANGTPTPFAFGTLVGSTVQQAPVVNSNYGFNVTSTSLLKVGGKRQTFLGRLSYDLTPDINMFGEYSYGSFEVSSYSARQSHTNLAIDRNNPYLPPALAAQMDANNVSQIRINRIDDDFGATHPTNKNSFSQFIVGVKGTVFDDWSWDASYVRGKAIFDYRITGVNLLNNYAASIYAVTNSSGQIVCGPTATNPNRTTLTAAQLATIQPNCVPFNPFGRDSMSAAAFNYITPPMAQDTDYDRDSASVNLGGEPFSTWAGPVSLAVGAEWWQDTVVVKVDPLTESLSIANAFFAVNPRSGQGETSAKEVYAEVGVPLAKDLPLIKALDFNGAVRRTDYDPSGPVTTWKLGATWDATDFLRIRATRSRDIRAPNVPELYLRGNDGFGIRTNPLNGISQQLNGATLNNPDLDPEEADTWTAGVILQPRWSFLSDFRLSADYYDIQINGVIGALSFEEVLKRFYLEGRTEFASYITFANTPIGFSRVDSPRLNLNKQETSGIDIELAYRVPEDVLGVPGRFTVSAQGSLLKSLETFDSRGITLGDLAGSYPKQRWTGNLNYEVGRFGVNLQARYNSSIMYRNDRVGPDDPSYNPSLGNSINKNRFPAVVYFNAGARYDFIAENGKKLQGYVTVDNLFDRDPPFASWAVLNGQGTGGTGGYNPYEGLGRFFKAGMRFTY